jgi:hypothetical protein
MYEKTTKPFSRKEKRVAIKLCEAKILFRGTRKQNKMFKSTLRRVIAFSKKNLKTLAAGCKPGSGRPAVIN